MKRKKIQFDAEALVESVEALAARVRGERKLTLRTRAMTLPLRLLDLVRKKPEILQEV